MKKLPQTHISKALFELIQDYLLGRTQKVLIGDQLSSERTVTSEVPQGSVLGPLLFLIYINDLPTVVFSSMDLLFADDAKLIFNRRAEQESLGKIQIDLQALHNWSMQNYLLFSLKKCSISEFQYDRNRNTLEGVCFIMEVLLSNFKPQKPCWWRRPVHRWITKLERACESKSWKGSKTVLSVKKKYHADHLHPDQSPSLPINNNNVNTFCIRMQGTKKYEVQNYWKIQQRGSEVDLWKFGL